MNQKPDKKGEITTQIQYRLIEEIAARKKAEEALRKKEERFRSLFENSTIGLYRTAPDGRILIANHALVQMLGYSSFEELSARNLEKEGFEIGYSRSEFIKCVEREGKVTGFESAWRKRDGSVIFIRESAMVIRADDGSTLYYEGTVEDITEHKRATQALRESEEKYRSFFEYDLAGNYISTPDGKLIDCNQAFLDIFGYNSLEEAKSKNLKLLYFSPSEHRKIVNKIKKERVIKNYEHEVRKVTGEAIFINQNTVGEFDKNNKLVQMRGYVIDVTKRKKAEEELKRTIDLATRKAEELERSYAELKQSQDATINLMEDLTAEISEHKKTEEELRRFQENFNNLFRFTTDAIFIQNRKREILDCNAAAEKLFGYSREELIADSTIKLGDQEKTDEGQREEYLNRAIQGQPQYFEWWGKRKDGSSFPDEIILNRTIYNGEEVVFATIRDITERKKTEVVQQTLRNLSQRLTEPLNMKKLALIIAEEARILFGYDAFSFDLLDEENGLMIGVYNEDTPRNGKAPVAVTSKDIPLKIIENQKSIKGISQCINRKHLRIKSKANLFGFDRLSRSLLYAPILWEDNVLGVLSVQSYTLDKYGQEELELLEIFADHVSGAIHRLKMEENLKLSEKKFRTLFEDSRDAIYISSADGFFVDFNPSMEELLGYGREELLSLSTEDLYVNKNDRLKFQQMIESQGYVKDYELSLKKKDGTVIDCLETASMRRDSTGESIGYQGIIRDITERKRVQAKLEEALEKAKQGERVKSLFLANMTHEIRTPLNAILGFTELIENSTRHLIGKEGKGFFDAIKSSGERLMRTIHEVLDISQIDAGVYDLKMEIIDLVKLVKDLVYACKPMADEKGLTLEYKSDLDSAYIRADQFGITQAINNIIDNAIKFTEQGGITVFLKRTSEHYELSIQDTGIGIAEEYLDSLFEAFSQESEGYTKKFQGIGLGMAVTKRHLDLNNLDINVESTKGVGTTFTLTFKPVKKRITKKQVEKERIKVTPTIKPTDKPLVLLVEDNPDSRKLITFFLKGTHNVCFAVSVKEAKQQLKKCPVDLILLDLSLVGSEDGLDLVRYLRKTRKWRNVPIIALTAHAFTTDRDNCLAAGCNDYLTKPIKGKKLLEKISEFV